MGIQRISLENHGHTTLGRSHFIDDIFNVIDDILSVELVIEDLLELLEDLLLEVSDPLPFTDMLKVGVGASLSLASVDLAPLLLLDDLLPFDADIPLLFGDLTDVVGEEL